MDTQKGVFHSKVGILKENALSGDELGNILVNPRNFFVEIIVNEEKDEVWVGP